MSRTNRPRLASKDDFLRFYGREPPEIWFGLAYEEDGEIVGMGIVHHVVRRLPDGTFRSEAWGSLDAKKPLPALLMHRTAKRTLAALRVAGEPVLYVGCDRKLPKAEKWLRRLGFSIDPELYNDGDVRHWSLRLVDV
jgi:hypothetical protein